MNIPPPESPPLKPASLGVRLDQRKLQSVLHGFGPPGQGLAERDGSCFSPPQDFVLVPPLPTSQGLASTDLTQTASP